MRVKKEIGNNVKRHNTHKGKEKTLKWSINKKKNAEANKAKQGLTINQQSS